MVTDTRKTSTNHAKTPILQAVHETAKDLERHGLITKQQMADYDSLCLETTHHQNNKTNQALHKHSLGKI